MKEYYTAAEISKIIGIKRQSVCSKSIKEKWHFIEQAVRGGQQKLFLFSSLPEAVKLQIAVHEKRNLSATFEAIAPIAPRSAKAVSKAIIPTPPPTASDQDAGSATSILAPAAGPIPHASPAIPASRPAPIFYASPAAEARAAARADLVVHYCREAAAAPARRRRAAQAQFLELFNAGLLYPALFQKLGPVSLGTVERWKLALQRGEELVDRRGAAARGETILTREQTEILLCCALHPNRYKTSEAIRLALGLMQLRGIPDGACAATYRRWLQAWSEKNYHLWTYYREGAKQYNDKCAYYIDRDYELLEVGDIVIADGHVLNFEIENPFTGKAKRMTLIGWLDMKSHYPLGWEIMPTENTAAISSALRRAIIQLGKTPKVAYLDNGRAFQARFFQGADFDSAGLLGLYDRLGMGVITAWPYHAQSKTIERFFGDLGELERRLPSYVGSSIADKPARMHRGERLHRELYERIVGGRPLTLTQAHFAVACWFDEYVERPKGGQLKGKTPAEVFAAGRGPGVDELALRQLMLAAEIKTVARCRIRFAGREYFAPELHGRNHQVTIRYDLADRSTIQVYGPDGAWICEASPPPQVHPAAWALGNPTDQKLLGEQIALKRRLEKATIAPARALLRDQILPDLAAQYQTAGLLPPAPEKAPAAPPAEELTPERIEQALADSARQAAAGEARKLAAELDDLPTLRDHRRYAAHIALRARGVALPAAEDAWARLYRAGEDYAANAAHFAELEQYHGGSAAAAAN